MLSLLLLAVVTPVATRADADAQYAAGRYGNSAAIYLELLRETPDNIGLLHAAGVAFVRWGKPREAVGLFQREMALTQGSLDARRWLATAFQEGNAFEVAYSLLQDLTTRDPKDAWSWYRLGLLMYQNGYHTAAVSDLDTALKLGVPPEHGDRNRAETVRAMALVQAGRAEEARSALGQLLTRPENAANLDLRLSMVSVEYEAGNYDAALAESDLALARDASNSAVHFWRARIFQATGKSDRALAEAERSRDLAPESPSPRNLLVRLYRTAGRPEDAAREAEWLRVREGEKQR